GVVGQRHVLVAPGFCSLGHVLQRVGTVRPVGVRVQVTLDVAELDQLRQRASLGSLDLALVLAKLGWNPRQLEPFVDADLALSLQQLAAGVVLQAEWPESPAPRPRQRLQALDVLARARVPDQRAAPRRARHDAQADLEP